MAAPVPTLHPKHSHIRSEAGPVPRFDSAEAQQPVSIVTRSAAFIEPLDSQHRQAWVAEAAFYLAEQRGFDPGHELEDWLSAERAIDVSRGAGQSAPVAPEV